VFLYLAQDGNFSTSSNRDYGSLLQGDTTNAGRWQINRIVEHKPSSLANLYLECDLPPEFLGITKSASGYHRMVITKIIVADTIALGPAVSIRPPAFSSLTSLLVPNAGGGVVAIIARRIVMQSGSSINADASGFSGGIAINSPVVPLSSQVNN